MTAPSRQSALDHARQGDTEALGELMRDFRPYVRMIVRSLRGGRLSARLDDSDLIQDALVEATRSFAGFQGTTVVEFTVWLRQITIRTAGRRLRDHHAARRDPGREVSDDGTGGMAVALDPLPVDLAVRQERSVRVAEAIAGLPEDMQQVILARHLDGRTHEEIARSTNRSPGAVRMQYLRAIRRLRDQLQNSDFFS